MFGLTELGSALLDLPDVRFATGIRNSMKKLPSELARDFGNDEMANNIEKFSEVSPSGAMSLYRPNTNRHDVILKCGDPLVISECDNIPPLKSSQNRRRL